MTVINMTRYLAAMQHPGPRLRVLLGHRSSVHDRRLPEHLNAAFLTFTEPIDECSLREPWLQCETTQNIRCIVEMSTSCQVFKRFDASECLRQKFRKIHFERNEWNNATQTFQ